MKTNVKKFLGRENKYREEIKRVQKERKEKKKEAKKKTERKKERKDGQDKPNENLSDEKWRSRARVKPLLDEQETTEDGKELNKAIVQIENSFLSGPFHLLVIKLLSFSSCQFTFVG